jgi:hypothetical protein
MDNFDYIGVAGLLVWVSSVFMVTQLFLGVKLADLAALYEFIIAEFNSTITSLEEKYATFRNNEGGSISRFIGKYIRNQSMFFNIPAQILFLIIFLQPHDPTSYLLSSPEVLAGFS